MAFITTNNSAFKFQFDDRGVTNFLKSLEGSVAKFDGAIAAIYTYLEELILPAVQDTIRSELHPANFAAFMAKRTKVNAQLDGHILRVVISGKLESELSDESDVQGKKGGNYNLWKVQEFGAVIDTKKNASPERRQIIEKDIGGVKVLVRSTGRKVISKHVGAIKSILPAIALQIDAIVREVISSTVDQVMYDVLRSAGRAGKGWTIRGHKALEFTGVSQSQLPHGSSLTVAKTGQISVHGAGGRFVRAPNIPTSVRRL